MRERITDGHLAGGLLKNDIIVDYSDLMEINIKINAINIPIVMNDINLTRRKNLGSQIWASIKGGTYTGLKCVPFCDDGMLVKLKRLNASVTSYIDNLQKIRKIESYQ